jgi:hypothetical protein
MGRGLGLGLPRTYTGEEKREKAGVRSILLGVIRLYQLTLSRVLPPSCRFVPSCSQYGYEAIARYGVWRGGWLAVKRVARCHPLNPGGYDPVPDLPIPNLEEGE